MKKTDSQNILPTIFIILGATGDLMRQKLIPALFHLYKEGNLPKLFQVVGFSKDSLDNERFQQMVIEMVKTKVAAATDEIVSFSKFFVYQQGTFREREGYKKLVELRGIRDKEWRVCSKKLFYLGGPPPHLGES